jgi:CheY-like chemotaxis protein
VNGKKILIVDDDPQVTTIFSQLLAVEGAIVESADTKAKAVEMLKKGFDVAVIDIELPDGSGLDLIREAPEPRPFFVVLTNSMKPEHRADAMESNVRTFIQKADHDPNEIIEMIRKHYTPR